MSVKDIVLIVLSILGLLIASPGMVRNIQELRKKRRKRRRANPSVRKPKPKRRAKPSRS